VRKRALFICALAVPLTKVPGRLTARRPDAPDAADASADEVTCLPRDYAWRAPTTILHSCGSADH
jgi:hypothetical protein